MKNPAAINKPNLSSPIGKNSKKKGNNLPYLRFRRRLRRDMLRGM